MDNKLFKLNAILMRALGMYKLDPNWKLPRRIGYYVCTLVWIAALCSGFVFNVLGIVWGGDVEKISDVTINIINIELFGSVLLRALYFAKDNTKIDHLSERFASEFVDSSRLAFKPINMDFIKLVSKWLIYLWTAFVILAGLLMAIGPLLKTRMELPYKIYAWYDLEDPFYYTITVVVEFLTIEFMLVSHGNMDMLHATFMLLATGQVEILAIDFANVIHDALKKHHCTEAEILDYMSYGDDGDDENNHRLKGNEKIELILKEPDYKEDAIKNLVGCIERHQKLLQFINDYQNFISPYLLVEVNFNFSYLIVVLFTFVTIDDTSMYPAMFMYVSGCIAQIFLNMYLGDRLSSSIDNLRDMFYDIPWYLCDRKFLTNYKIVQIRMSKPVTVYAGKLIAMTSESFLGYMKRVFSFYTVLRQVY